MIPSLLTDVSIRLILILVMSDVECCWLTDLRMPSKLNLGSLKLTTLTSGEARASRNVKPIEKRLQRVSVLGLDWRPQSRLSRTGFCCRRLAAPTRLNVPSRELGDGKEQSVQAHRSANTLPLLLLTWKQLLAKKWILCQQTKYGGGNVSESHSGHQLANAIHRCNTGSKTLAIIY